ncbi:hypothetical protein IQ243_11425 [Nostocales cyanobacterium LEGE 11386]|nr:hypothetical protein [Nostocales cyanobacterium LEGE 11386]
MRLGKSKAVQVLNTYLKFCKARQREGKITDKNFNRIRYINGCINGQKDKIREDWGDIFDEIYCLLQQPEIKLRLEKEQREIQIIRQNRKIEKQKSLSNIQLKNNLQNKIIKTKLTASPRKNYNKKKNRINQHLISNKNSKNKKQK